MPNSTFSLSTWKLCSNILLLDKSGMQNGKLACVVKQLDNPCRWFIYVLIINTCNLTKVVRWYSNDLESTFDRADHFRASQTKIIPNDSAARMLLFYRLSIWTHQVYMHQIPCFWFCYVLRWQMSINSLSIFELLTYLARLSIQLYLRDKAFPITYFLHFFCKSTTTLLV